MVEMDSMASRRPYIVVVDTNVWRSSQLLRDHVSASLLYTLEATHGYLGMPEVIEREILKHGVIMGREARAGVERHLRTIRALVGRSPAIALPDDAQFHSATFERIQELDHLLHRTSFTPDLALRSLDRVNLQKPPAQASQQFKDCVVWENCLDLAADFDVHLITQDRAFYEKSSFDVLEKRLQAELAEKSVQLKVQPSIEAALPVLMDQSPAAFEPSAVVDTIDASISAQVRASVEGDGFILGQRQEGRLQAFVTETSGRLALTFALTFNLQSDEDLLGSPWATAQGQCLYDMHASRTFDVKLDRVLVYDYSDDGTLSERKHAYVYGYSVLGPTPPVPHSVRARLPGGSEYAVVDLPARPPPEQ